MAWAGLWPWGMGLLHALVSGLRVSEAAVSAVCFGGIGGSGSGGGGGGGGAGASASGRGARRPRACAEPPNS
jgi:hypothetical protein